MATKKDFAKLIDEGADLADKEFAGKISSLTSLTDKDILDVLNTTSIDKADLAQLLQIVKDNTNSNETKAKNINKIKGGSEVLVQLLSKLL